MKITNKNFYIHRKERFNYHHYLHTANCCMVTESRLLMVQHPMSLYLYIVIRSYKALQDSVRQKMKERYMVWARFQELQFIFCLEYVLF